MIAACHLTRLDPSRNVARYYRIEVERTLFGEVIMIRRWGRIGTLGRRREVVVSLPEAAASLEEVVIAAMQAKLRRGYRLQT